MKRGVRISTTKELMKVFAVLILVLAFGTLVAQQFDMNRAEWLKNLGPIMANGFCNGCGSHFMRIYKGVPSKCVAEVGDLFDRCANKEPRVMLPERLTGLADANSYGQVIAACISAYYQGGAALDTYQAATPMHDLHTATEC